MAIHTIQLDARFTCVLDTELFTLTVSGIGRMPTFSTYNNPLKDYKSYIKYITINEGATAVSSNMFDGYSEIISVTYPSSLIYIDNYAFRLCTKLSTIEPSGVSNVIWVSYGAFYKTSSLKSFNFDKITYLGSSAFMYSGLESVDLSKCKLTEIVSDTFSWCANLTTVNTGIVSVFRGFCFYECRALENLIINDPNKITGLYAKSFGNTSISEFTFGTELTKLESAFSGSKIKSIDLSATIITVLSSGVFSEYYALESVIFNDLIHELPQYCFQRNHGLLSITIPSQINKIGYLCFSDCSNLSYVSIPSSVIFIDYSAFHGCSSLATVVNHSKFVNPDIVSNYDYYTIFGEAGTLCASPEYHGYNSNYNMISDAVVNGYKYVCMDSIAEFELGRNIKGSLDGNNILVVHGTGSAYSYEAGTSPLFGYTGINDVIITPPIKCIGSYLFESCSLSNIKWSFYVGNVEEGAFYNCVNLKVIPSFEMYDNCTTDNVELGNKIFYGCSALDDIIFSKDVGLISDEAFYGCTSLSTVILPHNLKHIGDRAFNGCSSLESIIIPFTLLRIGQLAFSDCERLSSITNYNIHKQKVASDAFKGAGTLAVSKNAYSFNNNDSFKTATLKAGYKFSTNEIPIACAEDLIAMGSYEPHLFAAGTKWETLATGTIKTNYIQVCDIDLIDYPNWTPIFEYNSSLPSNYSFIGNYNGNNHSITNLKCDAVNDDYIGLFGYLTEPREQYDPYNPIYQIFKDLRIYGDIILNYCGGLLICGADYYWSKSHLALSNIHTYGSVSGDDSIGGIVGEIYAETIILNNCTSVAKINAINNAYDVGGIAGELMGWNMSSCRMYIDNCHYNGIINNICDYAGGIVGELIYGKSLKISNCTVSGSISTYLADNANDIYNTGGIAGTISQRYMTSFDIYNFTEDIDINKSSIIDSCTVDVNFGIGGNNAGGLVGGLGTNTSFVIRDCILNVNINTDIPAQIRDDGDLDSIGGLIGYFGSGGSTLISNCHVNGIICGADIGGLIGECSSGADTTMTIEKSSYSGTIYNHYGGCGGLIGAYDLYTYSNYSPIMRSLMLNENSVKANIVILNDYTVYAGGIAGYISCMDVSCPTEFLNNYFVGDFIVNHKITPLSRELVIGGIIGDHDQTVIVMNCYSAMSLSSTSTDGVESIFKVNGILDENDSVINNCYYDFTLLPDAIESIDVIPKTTSEMKLRRTFEDWDFLNVWRIDTDINEGYPAFPDLGYYRLRNTRRGDMR